MIFDPLKPPILLPGAYMELRELHIGPGSKIQALIGPGSWIQALLGSIWARFRAQIEDLGSKSGPK